MGSYHKDALAPHYELHEYHIESVLGHGGFGITYLAHDTRLETKVAIKEYLPYELVTRQGEAQVLPKPTPQAIRDYHLGLKNFVKEARALAHFKHPNIVRVLRYLEANGTAYMVMEYEEGGSLAEHLKRHGPRLSEAALFRVFLPVLGGLRAVHEADMLHLDIKPENIYLRRDGSPMLIDFGSARQAVSSSAPDKFLVTHGYAPIEQYPDRGRQGPWTDIYAIGASMYRCVGGKRPVIALERYQAILHYQPDPLAPATVVGKDEYSSNLLECIDWAMKVYPKERPQSVRELLDRLVRHGTTTKTTTTSTTFTGWTAPSPPTMRTARARAKPAPRRRTGLWAALLVALAVVAAGAVYLASGPAPPPVTAAGQPRSSPSPATTATPAEPRAPEAKRSAAFSRTQALPPQLKQTLAGHADWVQAAAFSPDGKRLATAGGDATVRIWDSATGASLGVWRGHAKAANAVAFSPDGRLLASAGNEGTVRLWEAGTGRLRVELRGPGNSLFALAFSPDGRLLAAGGRDRTVLLWETESGKRVRALDAHRGDVYAVAFSPDGKYLATAGADKTILLWETAGRQPPVNFSVHKSEVLALAFSPDGHWLASGTAGGVVRLLETEGTWQVRTWAPVQEAVLALAFSPDGRELILGVADNRVWILDADNGRPLHTLEGHQGYVQAVATSPDGRLLASGGRDRSVRLWKYRW